MLEERALGFVDPLSGSLHHADHVRYADDLLTVGLANSFRQVAWRALDWDRSWRRSCTPACLEVSKQKRHYSARFTGPGSRSRYSKMREEWAKLECMRGRLGDANSL
eukprot:10117034-Heterocapsa_arctica.AAC.1